MSFSKLNNFTSLLLSGALGAAVVALYLHNLEVSIPLNLHGENFLKSSIAIVMFMAAIMLTGITTDSIATMIVRPIARKANSSARLAKLLLVSGERSHAVQLRGFYETEIRRIGRYEKLLDYEELHGGNTFISSYFLHSANDHEIAWVMQHYTSYRLASNFALLIVLGIPGLLIVIQNQPGSQFFAALISIVVSLSLTYFFLVYAARSNLRVSQYMISQATLHALEEVSKWQEGQDDVEEAAEQIA